MTLLAILGHWLIVNVMLGGFWLCYQVVKMADADREFERKARCREAAAKLEPDGLYPLAFRVGSLAQPIYSRDGQPATFALIEDLMPKTIEAER